MISLSPHLVFDGNARQAIEFYAKCFGGKLEISTYQDSPDKSINEQFKTKVMHSVLYTENATIMAFDQLPGQNLKFGDNIHLSISCLSESELTKFFFSLSENGEITLPLQDTFWGARFGQIKDQFGINWMLSFQRI